MEIIQFGFFDSLWVEEVVFDKFNVWNWFGICQSLWDVLDNNVVGEVGKFCFECDGLLVKIVVYVY